MNTKRALAAIAVAATLTLGARSAFADPSFPWAMTFAEADEKSEREADRYEQGTDAIDDEDWADAIQAFRDVAQMKSSRADGALYWMAYALNRSGRRAEALTAI